ncbi:MAG: hypoxanthine phosphoribosyltransferase [Proteobacteria bacterium]|nr:hypoxanthine phosphoribosyltransferase [Pseudomonadota bacterium]
METKNLKILYPKETIQERVTALAGQIYHDYQPEEVLVVGVLKGSFVFLADLVRELKLPLIIDFVRLSSYGNSLTSSGTVKILKDLETSITGKNVIIVEDIIDTGLSIKVLKDEFTKRQPRSLKICALIDKNFRRKVEIDADYVGITMDRDYFIVGYGLDWAENYRQLPDICSIEP